MSNIFIKCPKCDESIRVTARDFNEGNFIMGKILCNGCGANISFRTTVQLQDYAEELQEELHAPAWIPQVAIVTANSINNLAARLNSEIIELIENYTIRNIVVTPLQAISGIFIYEIHYELEY